MQPPIERLTVTRWQAGVSSEASDEVAEECPVALLYQGMPHVVMMATPADLEDLAVGFTITEGIVDSVEEIRSVAVGPADVGSPAAATGIEGQLSRGLEARVAIPSSRMAALLARRRNLTARGGCGLCGAESVDHVLRHPGAAAPPGLQVEVGELHAALRALRNHQPINARVGSVHAAAWCRPGKGLELVREDVGRHNALDKTLGALYRQGISPASGYLIVTSRASYEMVQKAAMAGVSLLAAVSAPTAFAIRLAQTWGLTLIGFARENQHVVYAHAQRLRA